LDPRFALGKWRRHPLAKLLDVPQLDPNDDVRTDVYWELATGELVVSVRNASGFGPGGRGYMLLHTTTVIGLEDGPVRLELSSTRIARP